VEAAKIVKDKDVCLALRSGNDSLSIHKLELLHTLVADVSVRLISTIHSSSLHIYLRSSIT
jgi:hypothetical protein